MKMSRDEFERLKAVVSPYMKPGGVRERWDALWAAVDAGEYDVGPLYRAGLNDAHIDTALRRVQRAQP